MYIPDVPCLDDSSTVIGDLGELDSAIVFIDCCDGVWSFIEHIEPGLCDPLDEPVVYDFS